MDQNETRNAEAERRLRRAQAKLAADMRAEAEPDPEQDAAPEAKVEYGQASIAAASPELVQPDEHDTAAAREARRRKRQAPVDEATYHAMAREQRPSFIDQYWYQLATLALIAINVVVYVVEFVLSGFSPDISTNVLLNMGAMCSAFVTSPADLYRFIAPMFLHMDFMHLLFNMVALYSVGEALEYVLGKPSFLLLYFVAGITGNMVSYTADVVTGSLTVSAGASTSVFGLFVAVALLAVLTRGNSRQLMEYSKGMLAVIVINLVYTLLVPGISLTGHLGGAIGGLIAMFMVPSRNLRVPNAVRVVVSVAWVAAVVYVLVSCGIVG